MIGNCLRVACVVGAFLGSAWAYQKAEQPKAPLITSIQGPDLYKAYCAECHGSKGKGDGTKAGTLKIAPPDLTRISSRRGGTFPLKLVEGIISGEEPMARGHGAMPAWGAVFSKVDRDQDLGRVRIDNLARYLREMQAK
ncbi:MAG: cytochrome c [Bryobacteraceae bacterium]